MEYENKKKAAELREFFQQVISGCKNEREELEEQIEKEVIDFEEQLEEQLEQDLIEQVEEFEKERIQNEENLTQELIKYAEHLDNDRIVQEVQRLNNECHNRGYNEGVTETKYWSESYILTNRPTTTSFRQHDPFIHDAWCKKKKHKLDKQIAKRNEILSMTHYDRL